MTEPRTRQQMRHYRTAYEVAMSCNGQSTRLAFVAKKTKRQLLEIAMQHGETICSMWPGDDDSDEASYSKDGWQFGPVRVHFTGRTERDCATQ